MTEVRKLIQTIVMDFLTEILVKESRVVGCLKPLPELRCNTDAANTLNKEPRCFSKERHGKLKGI